jgi:hypothetical protein
VGLRQPKLREPRIARHRPRLGLLLLQKIAEIELHRPHAGVGGELTARGLERPPVDNPEQAIVLPSSGKFSDEMRSRP